MSLVVARRRRADINVVPLIDVLVVLVFFLLISSRLDQSSTMAIIPPTASAGSEGTPATTLVVGVDRDERDAMARHHLADQAAGFEAARRGDASVDDGHAARVAGDRDAQAVGVGPACLEHGLGGRVVEQCQQQVFHRHEFMPGLTGALVALADGVFEVFAEHGLLRRQLETICGLTTRFPSP